MPMSTGIQGGASVILRRQSDEESPRPLSDCCVYILTNETHSLHMESESHGSIDLSAERSEALDSSLRFRMTGRRAAAVILRSKATKNPKPLRDCYVCILANETHRLYMESESHGSIDLSAERSEALDSSLRSE